MGEDDRGWDTPSPTFKQGGEARFTPQVTILRTFSLRSLILSSRVLVAGSTINRLVPAAAAASVPSSSSSASREGEGLGAYN